MNDVNFAESKKLALHRIEARTSKGTLVSLAGGSVVVVNQEKLQEYGGKYTVLGAGAARGGTTIVSYILTALGLDMGSARGGEDTEFVEARTNPKKLVKLISSRSSGGKNWGFKIPGLSLGQYSFLENELANPVVVAILRNPLSTSISVLNRAGEAFQSNQEGFGRALFGACKSNLELSNFVRQSQVPVIILNQEKISKNSLELVECIANLLSLDVSDERKTIISNQISSSGYKSVAGLPK